MGAPLEVSGMGKGMATVNAKSLMGSGGGKSSVVKGGSAPSLIGGPKKQYSLGAAGTKAFKVGGKGMGKGRGM